MRKVNKEILNTLAKVAESNDNPTIKLAAAVVRNNRIISIGMNRPKSHPFQKKFGKNEHAVFLHAEVHAIKNALRELTVDEMSKCELYVVRVKKPKPRVKHWVWGMAKPCDGCMRCIREFGLKRVVYSTDVNEEFGVL